MNKKHVYRIKTISEFHQFQGLPKPEHPLISVIDLETIKGSSENITENLVFDFYSISLKRNCNVKIQIWTATIRF